MHHDAYVKTNYYGLLVSAASQLLITVTKGGLLRMLLQEDTNAVGQFRYIFLFKERKAWIHVEFRDGIELHKRRGGVAWMAVDTVSRRDRRRPNERQWSQSASQSL